MSMVEQERGVRYERPSLLPKNPKRNGGSFGGNVYTRFYTSGGAYTDDASSS